MIARGCSWDECIFWKTLQVSTVGGWTEILRALPDILMHYHSMMVPSIKMALITL